MTGALLAGLVAGLGVAMPVGAVSLYLLSMAARTAWLIAAAAALGVATADGLYATVAVVGGAAVADRVQAVAVPLKLLAAAVLVGLAAIIAVRAILRYRSIADSGSAAAGSTTPRGAWRAYLGMLAVTGFNPTTALYFAALVLSRPAATTGPAAPAFIAGVVMASAGWQLVLTGGGSVLGRFVTGRRGSLALGLVSSLLIGALAVALAVSPL